MKKVLLLGASGSIGALTIDILKTSKDKFELTAFSVGNNTSIIDKILKDFNKVKCVYLIDKNKRREYAKKYPFIIFYAGKKGLMKLVNKSNYDIAVNALLGFVGLEPSLGVLTRNKVLALANKESLVTGGHLIKKLLKEGKGKLYPIDSEHVALQKCLNEVDINDVKEVVLTASGGALRDLPLEELNNVTPEMALKHPTWKMGAKITIDSATLMNKGFEVIEAHYLFDLPIEKIKVILHKESLVHSFIELNDGSKIIEYGEPNMKSRIEYALNEGKSKEGLKHIKSLNELKDLHFSFVDTERYPLLDVAIYALKSSHAHLVALNAIDEVMVASFLKGRISFLDISKNIDKMIHWVKKCDFPSLRKIKKLDCLYRKRSKHRCF